MSGWVKLHRNLLEWDYWDDHNTTRLLIYLIVSVNFEQKQWKGITINPGEIITSFEKLSQQTGLTIRQVRTSTTRLVSCGEVTRKVSGKGQAITLVKWEKMQHEEKKTTRKKSLKGQLNDKEVTTTKEGKEIQEEKETKIKEDVNILELRKKNFSHTLEPFLSKFGKDLLNDFYSYWTEPNKSNTKLRFELERTWEISRRLDTWAKRDKNFIKILNNQQHGKPKTPNASEQLDEFKRNLVAKYATENQNQTPDFEDGGYAEDAHD